MKHWREYALYKGDDFIDIGTADELNSKYGITVKYLRWLVGQNKKRDHMGDRNGYIVVSLPRYIEED